jgi:hypothetical protein
LARSSATRSAGAWCSAPSEVARRERGFELVHQLGAAELPADEGQGGAITLIQRFEPAGKLNIHLHCLALDGAYRCDADGAPTFVKTEAPTDDDLHAPLQAAAARS